MTDRTINRVVDGMQDRINDLMVNNLISSALQPGQQQATPTPVQQPGTMQPPMQAAPAFAMAPNWGPNAPMACMSCASTRPAHK